MNKRSYVIECAFIAIIIFNCSPKPININNNDGLAKESIPEWYPRPENDENYYQGVGSSQFNIDIQSTIDKAKQNALSDLISQIAVSFRSNISDSVWEESGYSGELFNKVIKTEVEQKNISNIEIVDTWIKKPYNEVWVYVRLKKKSFIEAQNSRNQLIKDNLSLFLDDGTYQYQKDNYGLALKSFFNAYYYSRLLIDNTFEIEYPRYSGDTINVNSFIQNKINNIIGQLNIDAYTMPIAIKSYNNNGTSIAVKVSTSIPGRGTYPLENLPVQFFSDDKHVNIGSTVFTTQDGVATNIIKLNGVYLDTIMISVKINWELINISRNTSIENGIPVEFSKDFPLPTTYYKIAVIPIRVFVTGSEKIDGNSVSEPERFVTRSITEALTEKGGFYIIDNKQDADLLLKIDVNCSYQNNSMNLINYTAYLSLDLYKNSFQNKIHTVTLPPVDGYGNDRRQAGILTLEKAGIKMKEVYAKEIINDIIKLI